MAGRGRAAGQQQDGAKQQHSAEGRPGKSPGLSSALAGNRKY